MAGFIGFAAFCGMVVMSICSAIHAAAAKRYGHGLLADESLPAIENIKYVKSEYAKANQFVCADANIRLEGNQLILWVRNNIAEAADINVGGVPYSLDNEGRMVKLIEEKACDIYATEVRYAIDTAQNKHFLQIKRDGETHYETVDITGSVYASVLIYLIYFMKNGELDKIDYLKPLDYFDATLAILDAPPAMMDKYQELRERHLAQDGSQRAIEEQNRKFATASLVLGILSIVTCVTIVPPFIFSVAALTFGSLTYQSKSKHLAVAGMTTAGLAMLFLIVSFYVYGG